MAVCNTGAGGFQQHAAEGAASVVEIAQQNLQRVDQIAAHGAAQAAALQQYHIVADIFHQQVVERDVAKFVDDDGGLAQRLVLEQAVEQRGLAGAEKAGEHGERNGLRRPAPIRAMAGRGHYLAELTLGFAVGLARLGAAAVLAPSSLAEPSAFSPPSFLATCFFFFARGSAVCTASG